MSSNPPANILLKKTRESKGLTLDIVHESTKIPLDALKAIEEGYSVRTLTPFYYRGFVKIYAQFLGIDPAEVFAQQGMPQVPASNLPKKPVVPVKSPVPLRGPSVVSEALISFRQWLTRPYVRQTALRLLGVIVALFLIVGFFKLVGSWFKSLKKNPSVSSVKASEKSQKQVAATAASAVEVEEPKMVKAQAQDQRVQLAVRAMKDMYIQVKSDGQMVFQMTMKKGTMESWVAKDQIELSGKNIHELDLEVNGKHIGSLGSSERRAKRVLITKDGLTVKK